MTYNGCLDGQLSDIDASKGNEAGCGVGRKDAFAVPPAFHRQICGIRDWTPHLHHRASEYYAALIPCACG